MQITTPDIGVDKATVAEILVKVGDQIAVDDSLVLLESDKASVEVPSTSAGVVKSIKVTVGDEVSEGAVLIELESEAAVTPSVAKVEEKAAEPAAVVATPEVAAPVAASQTTTSAVVDVQVPDIGVEKAVVGEILVQIGDTIEIDQSIVVVESDKATVEVPSTVAGTVESIEIHAGDTVKEGVVLLKVKVAGAVAPATTMQAAVSTPAPVAEPVQAAVAPAAPVAVGPVEITVK